MQNDEIEKKTIKKSRIKNLSQPGLIRQIHHLQHEIEIKKMTSKRRT
jgi:hypothetical protein